ncbi:MAG: Phage-related minor tail protein [Glomeribacter sp. 1016415]|nr:Phage-related minor tail protein [Glomeribacter sp. 1016415]
MVVDEFLFKLGFVADLKQAQHFRQTLSDVARTASIATTAVSVLAGGLTAFFAKALNGLNTLNQAARETGVSAEYLQQLGFAAAQNGASLEAATASVRGLSKVIGEAADGIGRGARAFEHYGLSAKNANGSIKSVTQMMGELQDKMQRLSDPQRSAFLQKMGIDAAMVQTLRLSKAELHELMQEAHDLGIATQEQADRASAWGDAMARVNWIFKSLQTQIALGLAPQLLLLADRFKAFLLRNKELIRDGLSRFIEILLAIVQALVHTGTAIDKVIRHTVGWKTALWALVGVFILVKRAAIAAFITNPVMWLAAAVAGLIILIDDFMTHIQGGESTLGAFWRPFIKAFQWATTLMQQMIGHTHTWKFALGTVITALVWVKRATLAAFLANPVFWIITAIIALIALVDDLFSYLRGGPSVIGDIVEAFKQGLDTVDQLWQRIRTQAEECIERLKAFFLSLYTYCGNLWERLADGIALAFEAAFTRIQHAWDSVFGWISKGWDKLQASFRWIGEKLNLTQGIDIAQAVNLASASAHPAASQVIQHHANQANRTQKNTVHQDIKIHIASSDPVAAGKATADALRQQRIATHNSHSAAKL